MPDGLDDEGGARDDAGPEGERRRDGTPGSLGEWALRELWQRRRTAAGVFVILIALPGAWVWSQIPEGNRERLLDSVVAWFKPTPDLVIVEPKDPEKLPAPVLDLAGRMSDLVRRSGKEVRILSHGASAVDAHNVLVLYAVPSEFALDISATVSTVRDGERIEQVATGGRLLRELVPAASPFLAEALFQGLGLDPATFDRKPDHQPRYQPIPLALYKAAQEAEKVDKGRALALVGAATETDPTFAMAHWYRGALLTSLGRTEEATLAFRKAELLSPDHERLSADYDPVGIILKAMPKRQDWQSVRPGMQAMSIRLQRQARTFVITAWRLDPKAFEFKIVAGGVDGTTVAKLREQNQGVLAVNAGFFEHDPLLDIRKPVGLRIIEAVKMSEHWRSIPREKNRKGGGALAIDADGLRVVPDRDLDSLQARYAVQSSPVLIEHGGIWANVTKNHIRSRRTAVCIEEDGMVVFLLVHEGELSLHELARLFGDPERTAGSPMSRERPAPPQDGRLACDAAIALDGGPSTQASAEGRSSFEIPGGWPIYDAILALPREKTAAKNEDH